MTKLYSVAAPDGKEHTCDTVVLRPINFSLRKPTAYFLEALGNVGVYDSPTMFGGPLSINSHNDGEEAMSSIEIAINLHGVNKVILIAHQGDSENGLKNSFNDKCSDREFVVRELLKAKEKVDRKFKGIDVDAYMECLSNDGSELLFFKVFNDDIEQVWKWPFHENQYDGIILRCMDFRFRAPTMRYIEGALNMAHYDLASVPGAAKGIVERGIDSMAFKSVELAVNGHGANKVVIINHVDCGAYGGTNVFNSSLDEETHLKDHMDKAVKFLQDKFPSILFETYLQKLSDNKKEVMFIPIKKYQTHDLHNIAWTRRRM